MLKIKTLKMCVIVDMVQVSPRCGSFLEGDPSVSAFVTARGKAINVNFSATGNSSAHTALWVLTDMTKLKVW